MTIMIYGGLGHVGSWTARKLIDRGHDVVIADMGVSRFDAMGLDYLEEVRDRITLEAVDVLDSETMFETALKYRDRLEAIVFGVAVIAGPTFKDRPKRNISINTMGMVNALEIARILGVPKFVNLSSGAIYGDAPGGQTEETPVKVTDLYGATKAANEAIGVQYGETYGIDVRNARLYFVYGPGKRPREMHALYQAMFGPLDGMTGIEAPFGGGQSIDWTHVEDTAEGIAALLEAEGMAGQSVNISSGVAYEHGEIIERVSQYLGANSRNTVAPGPFVKRGAPLDISKARREIGFEPRYADIDAGIASYGEWLAQRGT